MQRVAVQLSTIVVALAFGMATFAQEPAPSAPPAAPVPSAPAAPAPEAPPSAGSEMKAEGEKHQSRAERKAEKKRRKAEKKAEKQKRKAERKARKQGQGHDNGDAHDDQAKETEKQ